MEYVVVIMMYSGHNSVNVYTVMYGFTKDEFVETQYGTEQEE
jgi:hypothetical protein